MTEMHHGAVAGEGANLYADGQASAAQVKANRALYAEPLDNAVMANLFSLSCTAPVGMVEKNKLFYSLDWTRSGAVLLHNVTATMEAEIVVSAGGGLWHRSTFRYLANWIFRELPTRRLICRIPANQPQLQDYARRAGFQLEGRAKRYFSDDIDATVWVMFANTCPWLKG